MTVSDFRDWVEEVVSRREGPPSTPVQEREEPTDR